MSRIESVRFAVGILRAGFFGLIAPCQHFRRCLGKSFVRFIRDGGLHKIHPNRKRCVGSGFLFAKRLFSSNPTHTHNSWKRKATTMRR